MDFIYLIFYACLTLRFLCVKTKRASGVLFLISAEYFAVMCGGCLVGNLSDLTVASSQYDILLCSETIVSDMRYVSEFLVPGFGRTVLLRRGKMPHARGPI